MAKRSAPREAGAKGSAAGAGGALVVAAAAVLYALAPGTEKNGFEEALTGGAVGLPPPETGAGSGPPRARLAAARSTNLAARGGAGAGDGAGAGAGEEEVLGLRMCCLRSRILDRTAVERSSLVGVWVVRPTGGVAVGAMGSARGSRLDESGASAHAAHARDGWIWTEKVVVPRRRVLQPVT